MRKLLFRKPVWGAVGLALVAALVVSVMALTGGDDRAEAIIEPPGCTGGGIQQTLGRTPAVAHVGDTITYEITVFNGPFPPSCQITDIVTTFTTPDGVSEVLPVPSTLNPGESSPTYVRTYVIAAGDVQPDDNVTAELYSEGQVQDSPVGSTDTEDYDEAITTVVHPCLEVTKEVEPTTSKEGDTVDYTICVENCGDIDLERISVDDDVLGDKSGDFEDILPVAGSECEQYPYTIPPGAPDPLENTVTATYWDGWALPPEIAQTLVETASAEVDLVHPDLEISKVCYPAVIPLGDDINWDVTVHNTGDVDLLVDVEDPTAGISVADIPLAPGASQVISASRPVTVADVPAISNTAMATATLPPELGLPNVIEPDPATATCEVTISPCLEVTKEVEPTTSKEGDEVVYEICVFNCGNVDLELISVIDDVLGDKSADFEAILPVMGSECEQYPYTIPPGAPDPLVNTVTATYRDLLAQDWTATASAEVDLVHPDFTVTKECLTDPVPLGEPAVFEIVVTNTGDVPLNFVTDDPDILPFSLGPGEMATFHVSRPVPPGATEVENVVNVTATLPPEFGLDNVLERRASDSCGVTPPAVGRMTGGGSVFKIDGARVTRGFEIHCDLREPNNIEVNWPGGNKFHMTSLTSAVCTEDPAIIQKPPAAPFDTFTGEGTGRLNGETGATIYFVFVDAGEPGKNDTALIWIWDAAGNLVLEVSGFIDVGNLQAHKDQAYRD